MTVEMVDPKPFLSSILGYRLLRSVADGTSIPGMRLDLIQELPFPEIGQRSAYHIQQHIDEAARCRIAAENAEREAIRNLEDEVLPAWLN